MLVNKRLALLLDHLLSDTLLSAYRASSLFYSVARYPVSIVSRLVRLGVDLNMVFCICDGVPCRCKPPLHAAVAGSNVTMVGALLRCGARINVPYNASGDNAVHLALEIAKRDLGYGEVLREENLTILRILLGEGRLQTMNDPASLNSNGLSWLNKAIQSCPRTHVTLVELFLSRGLCVDVADQKHHRTPLLNAVMKQRADLTRLLLDQGADCWAADSGGWTPFAMACDQDDCEIINLLLSRDATLIDTVVNERGETAEERLQWGIDRLKSRGDYGMGYYRHQILETQRLMIKLRKLSIARRIPFVPDFVLQKYYCSL